MSRPCLGQPMRTMMVPPVGQGGIPPMGAGGGTMFGQQLGLGSLDVFPM